MSITGGYINSNIRRIILKTPSRFFNSIGLFLLIIILNNSGDISAQTLTAELVADGFSNPVFLTSPPNDSDRLFVVEAKSGMIKIIKNGLVLTTPFIDLGGQIVSDGSEQGLLGMAFHPDYEQNGYFFVNYTGSAGNTYVARYTVSGANPDQADPGSAKQIIVINQTAANHNGGMLAFGLDGYLYIGMGDGGGAEDTDNNAQNPLLLLGKMLRIDVDTPAGVPYAIPNDNPYLNKPDTLDEIWSIGLRNPWRFSFDRATGDLYIADVGQYEWEEVNVEQYPSGGGYNYGWRCYEGTHAFDQSLCELSAGDYIYPVHEYSHGSGCSITGGYVYRGCAISDLQGTYFFSDFCTARIWSFEIDGAGIINFTDRTAELEPSGGPSIGGVTSFGEDADGELYIMDYFDGEIFKIVRADGQTDCSLTIDCGDVDMSGDVNILDIIFLIEYKFKEGTAPDDLSLADVNNDGDVNILDIIDIIDFKFKNGGPLDCPA